MHDDTHEVLKDLKARRRSKSIDEVIREMIRTSTGNPVEKSPTGPKTGRLTSFMDE